MTGRCQKSSSMTMEGRLGGLTAAEAVQFGDQVSEMEGSVRS